MPRAIIICLVCLAGGPLAADADFPPITDAERALDAVPWQPGAPAVVLFEKAEVRLRTHPSALPSNVFKRETTSYLRVNVRLKILTEEGKRTYGTQEIYYCGFQQLSNVDGRTVLADGRIAPLLDEWVLTERAAQWPYEMVAKLVFPAVEVGAILDYNYTLRWEEPWWYIPPWDFQGEVPARLSEITYVTPPNLDLKAWGAELSRHRIRSEQQRTGRATESRFWSEQLPGIQEEPYSLPHAGRLSRILMWATTIRLGGRPWKVFESWESTCQLFAASYRAVRGTDDAARRKARELAIGEGSRLEKIAAVHAFVRDEIETDFPYGILAMGGTVDAVLAAGLGRPIVKALLLQSMLAALDVDSALVWVADRTAGRVHFEAVDIWWFDAALVRIELDGEPLYLDPLDRSVGLGHIAPRYEGTRGLIFHPTTPEIVELPCPPFEHNRSRVVVDLEIGDDGRAEGRGTLELEGHQAARYLGWENPEAVVVTLRFLLATKFKGYEISDVEVEQDVRRQHVRVSWSLKRPEKEALSNRVTVQPALALPLGPITQPFTLPPSRRETTVLMDFGRRDDLVLTLRWPPGWEVDVLPEDMEYHSTAGEVECRVEADEVRRAVTFRRHFELTGREFGPGDSYSALRNLYEHASAADARSLVLVRNKTGLTTASDTETVEVPAMESSTRFERTGAEGIPTARIRDGGIDIRKAESFEGAAAKEEARQKATASGEPPAPARAQAPAGSLTSWPKGEYDRYLDAVQSATRTKAGVATGENGAVTVAYHGIAAWEGLEALKRGGSAADAALTAAITQVALSAGALISYFGVLSLVYYDAESDQVSTMNAGWNTLRGETDPMSIPGAISLASEEALLGTKPSGRTALVGGFMKAVEAAHARYGKLPFAALFEPAIYLAENGIPVTANLAELIDLRSGDLDRLAETRAVFTKDDGTFYVEGDVFEQPELAKTLRAVAALGADYMYGGPWGQKLVAAVQAEDGFIALDDLTSYEVLWAEPLVATFGDYEVYTNPWPSTGGVAMIEALNLARAAGLPDRGHWSKSGKTLRDALNVSMASYLWSWPQEHASQLFPGIYFSPEARVTPEHAEKLWARISGGAAVRWVPRRKPGHSDDVVAIDAAGNIEAITQSIGCVIWGKTAIFVDGISIGDPASFQQAQIASTGPGERLPEGTETGILFKNGVPVMGFASMGVGLHQRTLQGLLNVTSHGMTVDEAIDAPDFFHPKYADDSWTWIAVPAGRFPAKVLTKVGYAYVEIDPQKTLFSGEGVWVAISRDPRTGELRAASHNRSNSDAVAY